MSTKVAILGKQQPAYMRAEMKKLLEERGHSADILDMDTRNAADWIDKLKGYDALITAGEKFPAVVFDGLAGLANDADAFVSKNAYASNEEAFEAAVAAFRKIIGDNEIRY